MYRTLRDNPRTATVAVLESSVEMAIASRYGESVRRGVVCAAGRDAPVFSMDLQVTGDRGVSL